MKAYPVDTFPTESDALGGRFGNWVASLPSAPVCQLSHLQNPDLTHLIFSQEIISPIWPSDGE